MNCYFDTSALAKLFFKKEDGSETVAKLITDPANVVWVLELPKLNFTVPFIGVIGQES